MRKTLAASLLGMLLLANSGCAWMFDTLLDSVLDSNDSIRDGRDLDADGLTERDKRARFEERTIRRWENERRWDDWNNQSVPNESFDNSWNNHLSNGD